MFLSNKWLFDHAIYRAIKLDMHTLVDRHNIWS